MLHPLILFHFNNEIYPQDNLILSEYHEAQSTVESKEGEDRGEWTVNKRAVTEMWGSLP